MKMNTDKVSGISNDDKCDGFSAFLVFVGLLMGIVLIYLTNCTFVRFCGGLVVALTSIGLVVYICECVVKPKSGKHTKGHGSIAEIKGIKKLESDNTDLSIEDLEKKISMLKEELSRKNE